jgi:DNA-directed RNA polymerase specialized sigma24 family protein
MKVVRSHANGEAAEVPSLPYRRERARLSAADRRRRRALALAQLRIAGHSAGDLAAIFGLSERTVHYDLSRVQAMLSGCAGRDC